MITSQAASYSCTALKGTNKRGILRPDKDGYYTLVVGALDFYNSAGAFYPLAPAAHLFESSSSFQRRIAAGCLKGECGHPRPAPGSTVREFMSRVMDIYEPNVCCHFRRVWLDDQSVKDKNGKPVVAIMAEVKPAGPMGPALQEALDNPDENVCFSIRSITNDYMRGGTLIKPIKTIVGFDWVTEPGIYVATRWNAPGLESLNLYDDVEFTKNHLQVIMQEQRRLGSGLESNGGLTAELLMRELGWDDAITSSRPAAHRW